MNLGTVRQRFELELDKHYTQQEIRQHFSDLCRHFFGLQAASVVLALNQPIDDLNAAKLLQSLDKLKQNVPIQYILGQVSFADILLNVNGSALIPRPETEELVHYILESSPADKPLQVLDIGTGTGCIAIALKKAHPNWHLTAWDNDVNALKLAQQNAAYNKVNIKIERRDVLTDKIPNLKWDIIVSNPPYVPERLKKNTAPHVLLHEPHQAIFVPDDNPLLFYKSIAAYAKTQLAVSGTLFFEGHHSLMKTLKIFLEKQGFCDIVLRNDFRNHPRFIVASNS
jgi:release factor glutamine methyltransferase